MGGFRGAGALLVVASALTARAQMPPIEGALAFEVASIRPARPGAQTMTNLDLDPSDYFRYTGGGIVASGSLINYLIFAYRIQDRSQADALYAKLPPWAKDEYTLRAKAAGKPTKDELRQMVRVLLADRFQLELHGEVRELPVYGLVLDHAPAPGLTLQPGDTLCAKPFDQPKAVAGSTALPRSCQLILFRKGELVQARMSGYTLEQIAGNLVLASRGALDSLPVVDKTGLAGYYDLDITYLPPRKMTDDAPADEPGESFEQALVRQAGLKLVKQTGSVALYVIDRIERPTEN